jgi:hypothetical protein
VPRTRTLSDLRGDVRRRADIESALDRHPDADLTRYVNQGIAELYDLLIEARGRQYFRKAPPLTITTAGGTTTRYALPPDFYRLISVRSANQGQYPLAPFVAEDEPLLREEGLATDTPSHYEIQVGFLELLPRHAAGRTIVVDYVPYATELVDDDDTFDGINGWEEYVVSWAAKKCAIKDDEPAVAAMLDGEMAMLRARVLKLSAGRDMGRAERVKDVRLANVHRRIGRW